MGRAMTIRGIGPLSGGGLNLPAVCCNNVNAYHSRLKQWLRRFNGVATKNLPHYLGWRRILETVDDTDPHAQWLGRAMGLGAYQQLTR